MSKSKSTGRTLSEALGQVADRAPTVRPSPGSSPPVAAPRQRGRDGTRSVAGHFAPAVSKQLKQLALDRDTTVQELLREGINDLFRKHGKEPLA